MITITSGKPESFSKPNSSMGKPPPTHPYKMLEKTSKSDWTEDKKVDVDA